MATRWRSNPDIPQSVRDSQDRSQGYLHEDGEGNHYRRGNGYRISVAMPDPEVIEAGRLLAAEGLLHSEAEDEE